MSRHEQPIPVEVLRVEDKIFASLSLQQIGLLAIPLLAGLILLFMPPAWQLVWWKLAVLALVFTLCGLLAIRVNQQLLYQWLKIIVAYNLRPQTYTTKQPANQLTKQP